MVVELLSLAMIKQFGKEIDVDVQILGNVAYLEFVFQAMLSLLKTSLNEKDVLDLGMVIPI